MKRIFTRRILLAAVVVASMTALVSCVDDVWWPGNPPTGWNSVFYDQNLTGKWCLVQCNSQPVGAYDTNYIDFYGNGNGAYYYYCHGAPFSERIGYWCRNYNNTPNRYNLFIRYENGTNVNMEYWFTDNYNTLWMTWTDRGQPMTYLYKRIYVIPRM